MNQELPDVQAGFRKGRETRDQIANIRWIIEKSRKFQKNIHFCFIDYANTFVRITKNWKILQEMTTLPASWEICVQVKKQQLETDMEQWTGSKLAKVYVKAVNCHSAYLTLIFILYAEYITQNARLDEAPTGIKIARRNSNNLRYADDTTLMAESKEELKSLLIKVKEKNEKAGLKINI